MKKLIILPFLLLGACSVQYYPKIEEARLNYTNACVTALSQLPRAPNTKLISDRILDDCKAQSWYAFPYPN